LQISFIPHARRFAAALAIPVGATLVFASTALACPPPTLTSECKTANDATITVSVDDTDSGHYYFKQKSGELRVFKDETAVGDQEWKWPTTAKEGDKNVTIATIVLHAPAGKTVNGKWEVAVLQEEEKDKPDASKVNVNVNVGQVGTNTANENNGDDKNKDKAKDEDEEGGDEDIDDVQLVESKDITLNCVTPSPSPSVSPTPTPTPTSGGGQGGGQPGMPKTGHRAA
jgi:hypothetical protein